MKIIAIISVSLFSGASRAQVHPSQGEPTTYLARSRFWNAVAPKTLDRQWIFSRYKTERGCSGRVIDQYLRKNGNPVIDLGRVIGTSLASATLVSNPEIFNLAPATEASLGFVEMAVTYRVLDGVVSLGRQVDLEGKRGRTVHFLQMITEARAFSEEWNLDFTLLPTDFPILNRLQHELGVDASSVVERILVLDDAEAFCDSGKLPSYRRAKNLIRDSFRN